MVYRVVEFGIGGFRFSVSFVGLSEGYGYTVNDSACN